MIAHRMHRVLPPPHSVLAAFGISDRPTRLTGGQGGAFLTQGVVLKPVENEMEAAWIADVTEDIIEEGFRVARPIRAGDGCWIHDGWCAWKWVDGTHDPAHRWEEIIAAGVAFHRALSEVARPDFVDRADSPYRRADRIAWGEGQIPDGTVCTPALRELAGLRRPVTLTSQVIHGDLEGNVLFAPHLPPAVIDLSPYWRPPAYATAIVLVDALDWGGATERVLLLSPDIPEMDQLLLRAEMFRLAIMTEFERLGIPQVKKLANHFRTVELLVKILGTSHK